MTQQLHAETGQYDTDGRRVIDENGLHVADFSVPADAFMFVHCVNVHDELVFAAQAALDVLSPANGEHWATIDMVRDALARAAERRRV